MKDRNEINGGIEPPKGSLELFGDWAGSGDRFGGKDRRVADESKALYDSVITHIKEVYTALRNGGKVSLDPGSDFIHQMVDSPDIGEFLYIMALHLEQGAGYIYQHPVNVAILSVRLAKSMGFAREDTITLGMAALFHDVGTVKIPEGILNKPAALSDSEYQSMRQRPRHSFELLKVLKPEDPYLAEIAIQVHERIDGSGYPLGVQKDEINEYAQIIGLIDVYEALIHNRPHRKRFLYFPAAKEMIKTGKNAFQRGYLKALLNGFSIFPVYSYVRLNSGAIGRVIDTYKDQPLRPKVQVFFDSQERRILTERIIDLPDNPLLHIVASVEENEIQSISKSK